MSPLLKFILAFAAASLLLALIILILERKQRRRGAKRLRALKQVRLSALREQSQRLAAANEIAGRGSPLSFERSWSMHLRPLPSDTTLVIPPLRTAPRERGLAPLSPLMDDPREVIERARRSSSQAVRSHEADEEDVWQDTVPNDDRTTISAVHPITMQPIR